MCKYYQFQSFNYSIKHNTRKHKSVKLDGNSNKFSHTHNWDLEDDQLQTDENQSFHPDTAPIQDQNDSYDESLSEDDGDDDELYGLLQADYLTNPVPGSNNTPTASTINPTLGPSTSCEDMSETLFTTSSPYPALLANYLEWPSHNYTFTLRQRY